MTPREPMEHQHADPPSDHAAHTAPAEPHPIRMNLWQRWMAWSGSFFVLSLILHIVIIGGAAMLVVQVVQGRKEKLKFTAPPPSAAASSEHKVKPSKKTAAAAPAITKRITSSAANASIALPAMDMSSSTGPDVMASVMSGMGASGLGAGAAGGAGMASMPLSGLTAFGFKGKAKGLVGRLYDLKQTPDHHPTAITDRPKHNEVMIEFLKGWDEKVLERYYKATNTVTALQVFIPLMDADKAPAAFGAEKEIAPSHWIIHYKGTVRAPKSGTFRFTGYADDAMAVRFDRKNAFIGGLLREDETSFYGGTYPKQTYDRPVGPWFTVQSGDKYPIEIMISEVPGGKFEAFLQIEEQNPVHPYPKKTYGEGSGNPALPVFALMKGLPLPPYEPPSTTPPPNARPDWKPREKLPEYAPEPIIFPGL
ncbi:MAG: hypothetical protein WCI42_01080 [Verrucomicrobiota bacterium]